MKLLVALLVLPLILGHEIPKVTVYTVATEETDGLKRLLESAKTFNIDIQILGLGQKWNGGDTRVEKGGAQKIRILKEALETIKEEEHHLVLFVDAYDVIFTNDINTIIMRFFENFENTRVLFGAEPFCWPDADLAPEYPLVEFGKRFLNSGLFMGFAPEVYKMVSMQDVADNDDDQLYYTHIYLDEKLRKDLKISLDSMSRIFQNLNGVEDDVQLEFDDNGQALAVNSAYNTHPVILHGNGPSKKHLNYLANYVANRWNGKTGCNKCGDKSILDLKDKTGEELPLVTLSIIISKPIPFVEEVLEAIANLDYDKKRLALYIYNSQSFNIKTIMEFIKKYGNQFYTKKVINGVAEIGEREGRAGAIAFSNLHNSQYLFSIDADVMITEGKTLKSLIEYSANYQIGIVAPLVTQKGKLFSNFWGSIAPNGYYARSEDYMAIIGDKRRGYFNVPFVSSIVLINKEKMEALKDSYNYNKELDADMSMCSYARDNGHFMYVNNEQSVGYLIVNEDFETNVHGGHFHPELWEIFMNRELWEDRYLHPKYKETLSADKVHETCPDVYDIPFVSERFSSELIEEMEAYGKWSDGSNSDRRLAGGYENVPTRDIHMNQIGFERHWLYYLDEYVRPMQEKIFIGYFHQPIESHMMFVVRYKPTEQASLRPHHDASTYSIDIALNKKDVDYEGGGVRYVRYNCTVEADEVGYGMLFPGRLTHLHEGLPTTKGTRYILVSFINP